ncbi:hypothetical protein MMC07_009045 [Pseudocyphellaria aurata]|nr:hypothetical protein [Pseudocyphellaria aurata]
MASTELPKQYKACVYDAPGKLSVKIKMLDMPEPGPGEVLIPSGGSQCSDEELQWASLHPTQPGQVGGHEGVGEVVKLGPAVADQTTVRVGNRVGVKWVSAICGSCAPCLEGADALCLKVKISGYYTPGTFQQYVLGPANYVTPIPENLGSAEAAPLLCAGISTYAALRKSSAKPGQWVVISGAGGGLGHIAVQLSSRGMAHRVIGIDDGSKKKLVMDCGAQHFIDVKDHNDESIAEEVVKLTGLGASAVIVCTSNNRAYGQAIDFLRFGGTLLTEAEGDPLPLGKSYPAKLVLKQVTITAIAVGNRADAVEVLDFAARGIIRSQFRIEKMDRLTEVFQEMKDGKLMGRVVIDLQ